MGSLREAKVYGGVGSILLLVGGLVGLFVPFGSIVIPIVGLILVLIAVNYIAQALNRRDIFTDMIVAVVLIIVAFVVISIFVLAAIASFFGFAGPGFDFTDPSEIPEGDLIGLLVGVLVGLAIAWVISIIAAIFFKRSFDNIADGLGVNIFHTTGLLMLIGSILLIAVGIGGILIFVAWILMIVAFFSVPEELPQPAMATTPPPAAPPPQ